MRTINLDLSLKNLKNEDLKDGDESAKIGKLAANFLSVSLPADLKKNAARQYNLAMKIYNGTGEMNLEDADYDLIMDAVTKNELKYTNLIVGQLLSILNSLEKK